ncbi:hypothetical protein KTO58_23655 [Chitinophaga pendula]|uniref:hypothetical protein n=1 Tax=Chitinophaga TaxID=79328 RepID=UPI000BB07D88|nr:MULTISPECIES: hypothetical protein [Chitinophaga]ASZ10404.1 hypothetical protein CK934_05110 [Chitinophaga sp. MD30]UCJ06630.1 hypothetical protein KTO58_23655 [Chitinophaga pendula]
MSDQEKKPTRGDAKEIDPNSTAYKQTEKKPAEILTTDKADTNSTPLHEDLSERPERENKVVRDHDKDAD